MRSENFVQGSILPDFIDDYMSIIPVADVDGGGLLSSRGIVGSQVADGESSYLLSRRKRVLDIVVSLILILFFLPLLALLAIATALSSEGPVIFRQIRGGVHFQPFVIFKLRTMRLHDDGEKVQQAVRHDPRVTPLGRLLRKTSADELPQFLNVLKGEMSLVGPRPHSIQHDRIFMGRIRGYARRFECKPGITGLAQVSGLRGATETDEIMQQRVDADLRYLETASFFGDIAIMIRTLGQVLACRDTY